VVDIALLVCALPVAGVALYLLALALLSRRFAAEHRNSGSRIRFGHVAVDVVTFSGALDAIGRLIAMGRGGSVFTPNVDHVVKAEHHSEFRSAYGRASLSLADGMPLVWCSRLLGTKLPEKVSGSDLVYPLAQRAAERGWRVFLLGGAPGVGEQAARELRRRFGVEVVGVDDSMISLDPSGAATNGAVLQRIQESRADLVLVALGAPKQEIWIDRHREELRPAIAIGLGATFDFVAGTRRRAPRWVSACGLEWLHRLTQEPGRLWRRYLVDDPQFLGVLWRTLRERRQLTPNHVALPEG
jgi:N-acetylglucosaminyldiphosphoundecaprenol N-acetyl-beta-D-mannosaminyltransferase